MKDKVKLFEHFSTPSIFTELSGKFPQPNTTIEEWRNICMDFVHGLDVFMLKSSKEIKNDSIHNTLYYSILTYINEVPDARDAYMKPDGTPKRIPDDMSLLDITHIARDTIWWLLDELEKIQPLTQEQQDLWVEKSGKSWWCYEQGNTWCD